MNIHCVALAAVAPGHMTQQVISHQFVNLQQGGLTEILFSVVI